MRTRQVLGAFAALFVAPLAVVACVPPAPPGAPAVPAGCAPNGAHGMSVTCTFAYNGTTGADGTAQSFLVPTGIGVVTIDAWGAQGHGDPAQGPSGTSVAGGRGGHARGTFAVTPGSALSVLVGGQRGFNGGGAGEHPGGGASDVRVGGTAIADRIIVGGGGGGEGSVLFFSANLDVAFALAGGTGGGLTGGNSDCHVPATPPIDFHVCGAGATSTLGGAPGASATRCFDAPATVTDATSGALGAGGSGATVHCGDPFDDTVLGSGGGGGWYGGGGGGAEVQAALPHEALTGGGGGGSSYVVPPGKSLVNEAGVHPGNGLVTISYSRVPTSADACRAGGWTNLVDDLGRAFASEHACVVFADEFVKK